LISALLSIAENSGFAFCTLWREKSYAKSFRAADADIAHMLDGKLRTTCDELPL